MDEGTEINHHYIEQFCIQDENPLGSPFLLGQVQKDMYLHQNYTMHKDSIA